MNKHYFGGLEYWPQDAATSVKSAAHSSCFNLLNILQASSLASTMGATTRRGEPRTSRYRSALGAVPPALSADISALHIIHLKRSGFQRLLSQMVE